MDDFPKEPEPGHVEPSARVDREEDQFEATSPAETPREMLGVEAHKDVLEVVVQPEEIPSSDDDCLNAEKLANHSPTHFLKSKSCEICMRAKMTARQHRKREDLDPEEAPPLYFGHQMRVDHIIIGSGAIFQRVRKGNKHVWSVMTSTVVVFKHSPSHQEPQIIT